MDTLVPAAVQVIVFLVLLAIVTRYLGAYMARVFEGQLTFLSPVLVPLETGIYRLFRIRPQRQQTWLAYTSAVLGFSVTGLLLTYIWLRVQQWLPLNPQGLGALSPDLAFNTSSSFTTNTNWQSYVPETTVSYLTNMAALASHNFTSAAVGIVLAVALVRGFARKETRGLGNFWVDLTSLHTLYSAAFVNHHRTGAGLAGGHPELQFLSDCTHSAGRRSNYRGWTISFPGGDQRARYKWRRVAQRQ